jgi:hypothetical protein
MNARYSCDALPILADQLPLLETYEPACTLCIDDGGLYVLIRFTMASLAFLPF